MRFALLALLLALGLPPGAARAGPSGDGAERSHRVEKVAEGVYAILGQGGNLALLVGERSALLVDAQFERQVPALLETIRGITDRPLRILVLTHHHADHAGGSLVLEKQVGAIAAHVNTRRRMALQQARLEPGRRGGLPNVTFGEEDGAQPARMALQLDGTEVQLLHFAAAHTDGDAVVWVPAARVIHLGDLFFHGKTPEIDVGSGGSLPGLIASVERVLALLPEDARVIPGHGPVCGKRDLARFRDFLRACQAQVEANPGASGAELARTFDRSAFAEYGDFAPFLTWETFFETAAGRAPGKK